MNSFGVYDGRVPRGADLVTYWFEKARAHIGDAQSQACRLAWQRKTIRAGANLQGTWSSIAKRAEYSWPGVTEHWILDGAAVRVSIIGFR